MFREFWQNRNIEIIIGEEERKTGDYGLTAEADAALDNLLMDVLGDNFYLVDSPNTSIWTREAVEFIRFKIYDTLIRFKEQRRMLTAGHNKGDGSYAATHQLAVAKFGRKFDCTPIEIAALIGHDDKEDTAPAQTYDDFFHQVRRMAFDYFKQRNETVYRANRLELPKFYKDFKEYRSLTFNLTKDPEQQWHEYIEGMSKIQIKRLRERVLKLKGFDILHNLLTAEVRPHLSDFLDYLIQKLLNAKRRLYQYKHYDTWEVERQEKSVIGNRIEDWGDFIQLGKRYIVRQFAKVIYYLAESKYGAEIEHSASSGEIEVVNKTKRSILFRFAYSLHRRYSLPTEQKAKLRSKTFKYLYETNRYTNKRQSDSDELTHVKELRLAIGEEFKKMIKTAIITLRRYKISDWYSRHVSDQREREYDAGQFEHRTIPQQGLLFGGLYDRVILPTLRGQSNVITSLNPAADYIFLSALEVLTTRLMGRDFITGEPKPYHLDLSAEPRELR